MKKKVSGSLPGIALLLLVGIISLNLVACDKDDVEDEADDWIAPFLNISLEAYPGTAASNETIILVVSVFTSAGADIKDYPINLKLIDKIEPSSTNGTSEKIPDDVIYLSGVEKNVIFFQDTTDSDGEAECKVTSSITNSAYTIEAYTEDELVSATLTIMFN
jgi:hypothetical protein